MSENESGKCKCNSDFCGKMACMFGSLALFFNRLILAYGFYEPAMSKLRDIEATARWFESGLNIPYPLVNAYLAAGAEGLGVVLLTLGLFTRLISFPLMIVMIVAIQTVHWQHGFSVSDNGFEIPLYYFIMLFTLFAFGPGSISLDRLFSSKKK